MHRHLRKDRHVRAHAFDDRRRDAPQERRALSRRGRPRRGQSRGPGAPPRLVARFRPRPLHRHRALPPPDHLARVRREGQSLRQPAALARHRQGRQGRHPALQLPRVAAHLLRYPQDGRRCRAAQLPLHRRRDPILPHEGRGRRPHLRSRVHEPRGGSSRGHLAQPPAVLRGWRLPRLRRGLLRALVQLPEQRSAHPHHARRRRRHLLLQRHHGFPQGHPAPAHVARAGCRDGGASPRDRPR